MSSPLPAPEPQRGATLVVALVVVILVGLLTTTVSHEFLTLSRRVENRLDAQQVEAYLAGAETVARQVLLEDLRMTPLVDYGNDLWAQRLELPLPAGILRACIRDLGGLLDLNSLGSPDSEGLSPEQRRFVRLLQVLELDAPLDGLAALALANAVFDWVDIDDNQRLPGGAEDLYYLQQDIPGKAANRPFASVSELRLIRGMTGEIYRALTPHVTVWGNGFLNINSVDSHLTRFLDNDEFDLAAPEPPVVMRTINSEDQPGPLNAETAAMFIANRRQRNGFGEPGQLLPSQAMGLAPSLDGLGVGSGYFSLLAEMTLGGRRYQQESVIQRDSDSAGIPRVKVVFRHMLSEKRNLDDFCLH